MENEHTGVEEVPAAGEQQEQGQDIDFTAYLDDGETGAEDTGAADQEPSEQEGQQGFGDERVEVAFAKRLEAEREKMRREYETQYSQQQHAQPPPQQQYPQQQPGLTGQDLTRKTPEELRELADEWMVGTEVVRAMQEQQRVIAQQQYDAQNQKKMLAQIYDNEQKNNARNTIDAQRAQNPYLPEFDELRLNQVRDEVYSKTGYVMSYDEAYKRVVGEEALTGRLTKQVARNTQQQTIRNVAARDRSSFQTGMGSSANKPSIDDMSDTDFERMIDAAKQGKLAR